MIQSSYRIETGMQLDVIHVLAVADGHSIPECKFTSALCDDVAKGVAFLRPTS